MKNALVFALAVTIAMSAALWVANRPRGSSPSGSSQSDVDPASTKATPAPSDGEAELRAQIRAEVEAEVRAESERLEAELWRKDENEREYSMAEQSEQTFSSPPENQDPNTNPAYSANKFSRCDSLIQRYNEIINRRSGLVSTDFLVQLRNEIAYCQESELREREIAAKESMAAAMAAQARAAEMQQQALAQRQLERQQMKQQLLNRLEVLRANKSAVGSITRAQEESAILRQLTILESSP